MVGNQINSLQACSVHDFTKPILARSTSLLAICFALVLSLLSNVNLWAQSGLRVPQNVLPATPPNAVVTPIQTKNQAFYVDMGIHQNRNTVLFPEFGNAPINRSNRPPQYHWSDRAAITNRAGQWVITPVGNSLFRIHWTNGVSLFALQAVSPMQPLLFVEPTASLDQLWRIERYSNQPNQYLLTSLQFPGYCAAFNNQSLYLDAIGFSPAQQWWFDQLPLPQVNPIIRSSSQQVVANASLPPATVSLTNSTNETAIVLLADLRNPNAAQEIQIPPQGSKPIQLERDAGSTIVESFAISSPNGSWNEQQRTYQIPPLPLYDVSVYEIFLQSIAIDRTGTSPNPIEDVNYQPRSVGFFQIPPGAAITDRSSIDVTRLAAAAQNPGGVRPLPSKRQGSSPSNANPVDDPLKAILNEIQSRRGSF